MKEGEGRRPEVQEYDYINGGYIILSRKILTSKTFNHCKNNDEYRMLIQSLLKANFKDKTWNGIEIKRGQFITSIEHFAEETNTTPKKVRNFWKKFGNLGFLARKGANKYTLITICNYDRYQNLMSYIKEKGQGKGQSKGKQRATTKECIKNDKESNKELEDNFNIKPESVIKNMDDYT